MNVFVSYLELLASCSRAVRTEPGHRQNSLISYHFSQQHWFHIEQSIKHQPSHMVGGKGRGPLLLSQATWGLALLPPHQQWDLPRVKSQCVGQVSVERRWIRPARKSLSRPEVREDTDSWIDYGCLFSYSSGNSTLHQRRRRTSFSTGS